MEGVYVISINKEMVPKVSKWTITYYEKEVEPWIISNLNVDKLNYDSYLLQNYHKMVHLKIDHHTHLQTY